MQPFAELPAFRPLALFTALLVLKMSALAFATANARRKAKIVLNPEDTLVNPGSHAEDQEAPETLRVKRAHLNDLENIPAFLIVALLFTMAGASARAGYAYFGLYFVARVAHSVSYLGKAQPYRTIAFTVGQLALLGMIAQLVMKALG